MEVAIVSDTHFGYKWDSERGEDPFDNAREAFERTVDADIVVLPGDLFDRKVPKQEVLGEAVDCFNLYRQGEKTVELSEDSDVEHDFHGTPVIAIHGTHERRSEGFTNPVELLEKMDYLLHLHNEVAVFEKNGEKVAVHGMSGVPERYAPKVLEKFAPEPVEDAYNIFVFHQSVDKLVYTSPDHDSLSMEDLPGGFDLLVDGHIHWFQHLEGDRELVLPGSTITTQMNKVEAEQPKGYVTIDTETGELEFNELGSPRELFYEEIDVEGHSGPELLDKVQERMDELLQEELEKKPLVRLVLEGETSATVKKSELKEKYSEDAIMSITLGSDRGEISGDAGGIQDSDSIAEMGMQVLKENVNSGFPIEDLFELLEDGEIDGAVDLVEDMEVEEGRSEEAGKEEVDEEGKPGEENVQKLTEFQ
ncbi:MAG: DNA repair exonuclease [Candidatus Nanohaloarchaeota archaeon QJJ-7]|nr:DNA repair exonuclease [Candidatus Nanohaloarchaeota archaeon QJJ-7]